MHGQHRVPAKTKRHGEGKLYLLTCNLLHLTSRENNSSIFQGGRVLSSPSFMISFFVYNMVVLSWWI